MISSREYSLSLISFKEFAATKEFSTIITGIYVTVVSFSVTWWRLAYPNGGTVPPSSSASSPSSFDPSSPFSLSSPFPFSFPSEPGGSSGGDSSPHTFAFWNRDYSTSVNSLNTSYLFGRYHLIYIKIHYFLNYFVWLEKIRLDGIQPELLQKSFLI